MKRLLLAVPLIACAAQHPTLAARPHWTPTLRASVLLQCKAKFDSEPFCDCMTEKLESLSPDPDVEFTPSDLAAGLDACQALRPTTAQAQPRRAPQQALDGDVVDL